MYVNTHITIIMVGIITIISFTTATDCTIDIINMICITVTMRYDI